MQCPADHCSCCLMNTACTMILSVLRWQRRRVSLSLLTHHARFSTTGLHLFGPLKRHWCEVCHTIQQQHTGIVISKLNFSEHFSHAWLLAPNPANIVARFRKCGTYPINCNVIPLPAAERQTCDGAKQNPHPMWS